MSISKEMQATLDSLELQFNNTVNRAFLALLIGDIRYKKELLDKLFSFSLFKSAEGIWLDRIGSFYKVPRNSLNDQEYLQLIELKKISMSSDKSLLAIAKMIKTAFGGEISQSRYSIARFTILFFILSSNVVKIAIESGYIPAPAGVNVRFINFGNDTHFALSINNQDLPKQFIGMRYAKETVPNNGIWLTKENFIN